MLAVQRFNAPRSLVCSLRSRLCWCLSGLAGEAYAVLVTRGSTLVQKSSIVRMS